MSRRNLLTSSYPSAGCFNIRINLVLSTMRGGSVDLIRWRRRWRWCCVGCKNIHSPSSIGWIVGYTLQYKKMESFKISLQVKVIYFPSQHPFRLSASIRYIAIVFYSLFLFSDPSTTESHLCTFKCITTTYFTCMSLDR